MKKGEEDGERKERVKGELEDNQLVTSVQGTTFTDTIQNNPDYILTLSLFLHTFCVSSVIQVTEGV